jgi:excisionase family DNA binding protein
VTDRILELDRRIGKLWTEIRALEEERAALLQGGDVAEPPPEPGERVLSVPEAAALLGISEHTLKRHARAGTVPCQKVGKFWRFSKSELEAFVAAGQAPKGRDPADQMPRPHKSRLREKIAALEAAGDDPPAAFTP